MPMSVPDRVVVINLRRRPDRLATFHQAWAASEWGKQLGEPVVFEAVDGRTARLPVEMSSRPGAYGCWRSHVEVLSEAWDEGVATVAVFEDDAIPLPQSAGRLARVLRFLPSTAAGLWLDAQELGPGNRTLHGPAGTQRLLRAPLRTHGYILRRDLIDAVLPSLAARPGHVDHVLASMRIDLPIYGADPALVGLSDSPSDTESGQGQRSKRSR